MPLVVFSGVPFAKYYEPSGQRSLGRCIALAGVGADSHSVGLHVLRWALTRHGYRVLFFGIHNEVTTLTDLDNYADVVMLSVLDGHAELYLRSFAPRRASRQSGALWYIGGNLTVRPSRVLEEDLRLRGFRRVACSHVGVDVVLRWLEEDLLFQDRRVLGEWPDARASPPDELVSPAYSRSDWERARPRVLRQWRTGLGSANMSENAQILRRASKLSDTLQGARIPLMQPRCGVDRLSTQRRLFRGLIEAGADVLSFQVDSLTRLGQYELVEAEIRDR